MKNVKISFILLLSLFVFTACPGKKKMNAMKSLKENNYDFSNFKQRYHKGIFFHLPTYFEQDYNTNYLLKKDGISLSNFEAGIFFSCEMFDQDDVEEYKFMFDSTEDLASVHKYYISQRESSLKNVKISLAHPRQNKAKLQGIYQIVEGNEYSSFNMNQNMVYMIGTFEKYHKGEKKYFVIQLISTKEMSAYLLDDFKKTMNALH